MTFAVPAIAPTANATLDAALQHALDNKTKPRGSLGKIESTAKRIGLILNSTTPQLRDPQQLVFAGDHGITAHGVSAFPSEVTWQMVANFLGGGAAISVLSKLHGIALSVVDCGVNFDFTPDFGNHPQLIDCKVAMGAADSLTQAAMTHKQCETALNNGMDLVKKLPGNVLLLGEMGIGNTSAAALLFARLLDMDIAACTGAGTGLDNAGVQRKTDVLRRVLERHADATTPLDALAALGGLEIATMTGAVLQAAAERRVVLVDGFITSSAVLVASKLCPAVLDYCVFSHLSHEQGHRAMLDALRADPLLQLDLRLGEGSGAALAWPLLQAACAILNDMASFDDVGVARDTA